MRIKPGSDSFRNMLRTLRRPGNSPLRSLAGGRAGQPHIIQFNNFAIANDKPMVGNRDFELYWLVDDAENAFKDLSQKAEVILPLKQMPSVKPLV